MIDLSKKENLLTQFKNTLGCSEELIDIFREIPREFFVPQAFRKQAWDDIALPLHCSQTISQPSTVAYMTQQLDVKDNHDVLEIGTGSGYQTAILSKLAKKVHTVERHKLLLNTAETLFKYLQLYNITTLHGDGSKGWRRHSRFARILVAAASPEIPPHLADQLDEDNGIMILPIGEQHDHQILIKLYKTTFGFRAEELAHTRFVPLIEDDKVSTV